MIAMQSATIAIACLAAIARAQPPLPEILSRVTEEAEVLRQNMTRTVTQETLEQRTLMPPPVSGPGSARSPWLPKARPVSRSARSSPSTQSAPLGPLIP